MRVFIYLFLGAFIHISIVEIAEVYDMHLLLNCMKDKRNYNYCRANSASGFFSVYYNGPYLVRCYFPDGTEPKIACKLLGIGL